MSASFVPFTEQVRQSLMDIGYCFILIERQPDGKVLEVVPYLAKDKGMAISDEIVAFNSNSQLAKWIAAEVLSAKYVIDRLYTHAIGVNQEGINQ